ncbi:hypothetical protein AB0K47_01150 [Streptomyces tirandamycinicus]|uniref:hypothetical protein n=1 Tax=Streptomyces tirandamycinicus TaxID=2174846 RepID=UPI0034318B5B
MSDDAHAAEQLAELHGPDHNPFYGTYVRDWIALCDDLRDPDVRGYLILRSLVFEGKGVKNRVRVLTLAELCKLIPGPNKKPSSLSRIRELLRHLSAIGLVTTPEGGPVTTSSGGKAQGRPLRIKIHDQPANGFRPKWPNTEEKLASIQPEAERAAREAAERDASRAAAKVATTTSAGQDSDQDSSGWNSNQPGRNSNQAGQDSDQESGTDLGERAPYFPLFSSASSTAGESVADAVGKSAGGFARAGAREGAGQESHEAGGGSAASGTDLPSQRTITRSPRPRTVKTTPRREAPGFEMVRDAIPAAVAQPGTQLYVGLRRAINDLLSGNEGANIPRRTPEQVIARINRRWYGENADDRASAGYRGCARCTPSGCTAPRRSGTAPDGCDRILNSSSWLEQAILAQDCSDLSCEDGGIIGTDRKCRACQERHAHDRQVQRQAAELRARLEADSEAHATARAAADEWETARADEERQIRTRLGHAGVWGEKLEHQVRTHMHAWRERHPRPGTSIPAPARPAAAVPAAVVGVVPATGRGGAGA